MIDTGSDTWRAVESACESEIEEYTARITAPGISERDADFYRGALFFARRVLALGSGELPPHSAVTDY